MIPRPRETALHAMPFEDARAYRVPAKNRAGRHWWVNVIGKSICGKFAKVRAINPRIRPWFVRWDELDRRAPKRRPRGK